MQNKSVKHDASHQGAVESIALKDPKERTKMFELISQSREFAAEYDKKKAALLKARDNTQFQFNMKKSAAIERRQVSHEQIEVKALEANINILCQHRRNIDFLIVKLMD